MPTTVLLALVLISACVSGEPPVTDEADTTVSSVTMYYGGQANEDILSPSWDMPARFLVFLPLVRGDESGEPAGMLLKDWEHTPGLAVLLQDRFRRIGADVDVVTSPGRDRELMEAGEFDAFLVPSFNTSGPNLKKSMVEAGHIIPHRELERILMALDTIVDPAIRDRMFREMWPVIQEEQPVTILLPSLFVSVASSRVGGLNSPDRAIATAHMDELWIEEGE